MLSLQEAFQPATALAMLSNPSYIYGDQASNAMPTSSNSAAINFTKEHQTKPKNKKFGNSGCALKFDQSQIGNNPNRGAASGRGCDDDKQQVHWVLQADKGRIQIAHGRTDNRRINYQYPEPYQLFLEYGQIQPQGQLQATVVTHGQPAVSATDEFGFIGMFSSSLIVPEKNKNNYKSAFYLDSGANRFCVINEKLLFNVVNFRV